MKKKEIILNKLNQEEKSLNRFHFINNIGANKYAQGKLDLIKELKDFINGL